jgi:DNA-binding NarL/FixJ family response regulator
MTQIEGLWPVRILIADDHQAIREGLVSLLRACHEFRIVGQTSSTPQAIDKIAKLRPDVILLDLRLPECDGLATCRTLQSHAPEIPVIILTSYQEEDYSVKALSVGAWGCLSKIASLEEIIGAARSVELGQRSSPHAGKLPVLPPHLTVPYI